MPCTACPALFSSAANFLRLPGVPMHVPPAEQNALLAKCTSKMRDFSPQ